MNTYDVRVDYSRGTAPDTLQLPTCIKSSYDLSSFPVEFIKGDDNQNATLVVTKKENNRIHFFDDNDNRVALEDGGVLVPKSYADIYKIAAGDTIQL